MVSEAIDVTGELCSICLEGFDNGDEVHLLDCAGSDIKHMFCAHCWGMHERSGQRVRNDDVLMTCPSCTRQVSSVTVVAALNFNRPDSMPEEHRGTEDDPIVIE